LVEFTTDVNSVSTFVNQLDPTTFVVDESGYYQIFWNLYTRSNSGQAYNLQFGLWLQGSDFSPFYSAGTSADAGYSAYTLNAASAAWTVYLNAGDTVSLGIHGGGGSQGDEIIVTSAYIEFRKVDNAHPPGPIPVIMS